jgi:small GTP-binding protein
MEKPGIIKELEKKLNIEFNIHTYLGPDTLEDGEKAEYYTDKFANIRMLKIQNFDYDLFINIISKEVVKSLKSLNSLFLYGNRIKDISKLSIFKNLTKLGLYENQISDISGLTKLNHLTNIDLRYNKLINISPLKELKNISVLNLGNNQISDISALSGLVKIHALYIWRNQISDISALKRLTNIEKLSLLENKITNISELNELKNINELLLNNNLISDISALKNLKNLKHVDLSNNQISDISALKNLKNLKQVNLSGNPIKVLSEWICNFPKMGITWGESFMVNGIIFNNNPIKSPPIEIVKQGKKSLKAWFEANIKELNEIKVILIGEAKAGKTSLLRRLQKNKYNPKEEQTDGIIIETFDFKELQTFEEQKKLHGIKAYFWDFGGQEIMSSTHQFFLTNRSVYILILEARKDEKADSQVRDWLKRIQTFGGESPVIVVANKIELNEAFGLNTYELTKDFPQIKGFVNISCELDKGIDKLKELLEENILQAEFFKTEIDERWFPVKDTLQQLTSEKQYITQREFEDICLYNNLKTYSEQMQAIKFLNDLGIVLHFNEIRMSEYFVLDPYWVTTGVYKIITSNYAAKQKGEILTSNLDFIVNKEERKKEAYIPEKQKNLKYSPNELCYLSEIMAEFKLSYFSENREKILIPDLLDKETPATDAEMFINATDKLNLIYHYDYLPISIIHFFMVEIKRDIIKAWRTGVVLKCKSNINAQAIVFATENRINVTVIGEHLNKRDYLSIIRFFLDKVNSKFSLKTNLFIPLPSKSKNKNEVEYIILSNMEKAGETNYTDYKTWETFNISSLLNGIVSKEIIQRQAQTINNMYILNDNSSLLQNINSKDVDIKNKSKEEIMNMLYERFTSEFDKLHNRIDDGFDKTHCEHNEIKEEISTTYKKLIKEVKAKNIDIDKLEDIINNINNKNELTVIEVGQNIMEHINWAFKKYGDEINETQQEVYAKLKDADNWETKIKLSVPLLNLIGVNIEHSVKLNKYIKWIYNNF